MKIIYGKREEDTEQTQVGKHYILNHVPTMNIGLQGQIEWAEFINQNENVHLPAFGVELFQVTNTVLRTTTLNRLKGECLQIQYIDELESSPGGYDLISS